MKTFAELREWLRGAELEFGDSSEPVCQIFARFTQVRHHKEITCATLPPSELLLHLDNDSPIPIRVSTALSIGLDGAVEAFAAREISTGLWALSPSLNIPGFLHAFVILYDVPSPAPWERLIILPGEERRSA